MARRRTSLVVIALALLPACGLFLPHEHEWRFGEPPPEPPQFAWSVEGEVRDLRTLKPISGAEVALTTSRKGYARRTRTDSAGRFQIGYSGRANDVTSGEATFAVLLTGSDPSDDTVSEVSLRLTCPGWKPLLVPQPGPGPLLLSMEHVETAGSPRFDCGE